jgi:hypothetical protein
MFRFFFFLQGIFFFSLSRGVFGLEMEIKIYLESKKKRQQPKSLRQTQNAGKP